MAHVFISYHKNSSRDYARKLADFLIANGFDVWIDDRIDYGNNWEQLIFKAVEQAAAVIVIMTPGSYQSRWVQAERLYAEKNNKPVFPVLLEGDIFPAYLAFQTADVRDGQVPPEDFLHDLEVSGVQRSSAPGRNVAAQVPKPEAAPKAHDISLPTAPTSTAKTTITRSRRFEAAMPSQIIPTAPTEVWAKISLPDSEGLRGELPAVVPSGDVIGKEDARATGFPFKFPVDPTTGEPQPVTVSVRAKSAALTFDDGEITVELPPDYDSQTVIFTANLHANTAPGMRVRVTLDLVYEARLIAQISVSALVQAPMRVPTPSAWTLATAGISAPPGQPPAENKPASSTGVLPGELQELYADEALRGSESLADKLDDLIELPEAEPVEEQAKEAYSRSEGGAAASETEETTEIPRPRPATPITPQPIVGGADYDDFAPRPAPAKKSAAPSAPIALIASLTLVVVVVLFLVQSNLGRPADQVTSTGVAQVATQTDGTQLATATSTGGGDRPTVTPTREAPPQAIPVRVGLASFAGCAADVPEQFAAGLPESALVEFDDSLDLADPSALSQMYDLLLSGQCDGDTLTLRVDLLKRVAPPELFDLPQLSVSAPVDNSEFFGLVNSAAVNYLSGDVATAATGFYDAARTAPQVDQSYALYFMKANSLLLAGQPADAIDAYFTASQDSNLFARAANNRGVATQELLLANGTASADSNGETVTVDDVFAHLETAHQNTSDAGQQAVILTNIGLANLYFDRDRDTALARCTDALNFNPDYLLTQACLVGRAVAQAEETECPVGDEPLAALTQSLEVTARLGETDLVAWADVLYWQARLTERIAACDQTPPVAVETLQNQRADLLAEQPLMLQTDHFGGQ